MHCSHSHIHLVFFFFGHQTFILNDLILFEDQLLMIFKVKIKNPSEKGIHNG
jgi:hypothetical protein